MPDTELPDVAAALKLRAWKKIQVCLVRWIEPLAHGEFADVGVPLLPLFSLGCFCLAGPLPFAAVLGVVRGRDVGYAFSCFIH